MLGQKFYNKRTDQYVEAIQYLGDNTKECKEFLAQANPYFDYAVDEKSGIFEWYRYGYYNLWGLAYPSSYIVLIRSSTEKSPYDSGGYEVDKIETYSDLYINMHFWLQMEPK